MKTKISNPLLIVAILLLLVACSTKRDTFLSRNFHALTTRDNILYNGGIALDKGVESIKNSNKDNFWKTLPVERMLLPQAETSAEPGKNPDFEAADDKATSAIQKHSMNIAGQERNYQIDEAFLLLGKARYYEQRFFPALDAFNYILYKYPSSDKINSAKIWREKTNMRLGNDIQVFKNITKLLKEKNLKPQIIADANAILAETFLNLEQKDSAIVKLKMAYLSSKNNTEIARYAFILGQLYQDLNVRDSALVYFDKVIKMNRKADRAYLIPAQVKKAQLFDYTTGNADDFVKFQKELLANRENRPYKDILNHTMALFYDKKNDQKLAKEYYKQSLKCNSTDQYLIASNYRNIANMYFKNTDYYLAAKYYDSTLANMESKTRECIHINKIRKDLDEVIELEAIAKTNDSILKVLAMTSNDRISYYHSFIQELKKEDEKKKILAEKQAEIKKNIERNDMNSFDDPDPAPQPIKNNRVSTSVAPPPAPRTVSTNGANGFYFYNPSAVAFGKIEFKKKFGKRVLQGNWKLPTTQIEKIADDKVVDTIAEKTTSNVDQVEKPEYTTSFYIDKLPTAPTAIDSLNKERNFVYYKLGVVYKEKLKEYQLATDKLEKLLVQNPEEKLILPTWYNLYKIYQIIEPAKTEALKNKILSQYPDSRYAQIISNKNNTTNTEAESIDAEYNNLYKLYQQEQYIFVLEKIDTLITQYFGYEIAPKYELLKANILGKTGGLESYKKAMLYVADNYPSTEEGTNAREILTNQIPSLEQINFKTTESKNWKVIYVIENSLRDKIKPIEAKIKTFIETQKLARLSYTIDFYTSKESLIIIHGAKTEAYANFIADDLKANKTSQINIPAHIISNENYQIIQIKKNFKEFLESKKQVGTEENVDISKAIDKDLKKTIKDDSKEPDGLDEIIPKSEEKKN